jgi:hypothetical protein
MQNLSLEWRVLDPAHVALVFDLATWRVFEATAESRGTDAQAMITKAMVSLLGTAYPVADA